MSEIIESPDVEEKVESTDEAENMDSDLEETLDTKCDEYLNEGRSIEDIRREKEELIKLREEYMSYRYVDADESDESDDPQKVLTRKRSR